MKNLELGLLKPTKYYLNKRNSENYLRKENIKITFFFLN